MSDKDISMHLRIATFFATNLDSRFGIGKFRFGLSAVIDLIPGFGDLLDAVLSFYLVWIGVQMRLPSEKLAQMIGNIVFSFLIGLIPVIGDAGYLFYKPNMRNLAILKAFASVQEGQIIENSLTG